MQSSLFFCPYLTVINLQSFGKEDLGVEALHQRNKRQGAADAKDQIVFEDRLSLRVFEINNITFWRRYQSWYAVGFGKSRHDESRVVNRLEAAPARVG